MKQIMDTLNNKNGFGLAEYIIAVVVFVILLIISIYFINQLP